MSQREAKEGDLVEELDVMNSIDVARGSRTPDAACRVGNYAAVVFIPGQLKFLESFCKHTSHRQ